MSAPGLEEARATARRMAIRLDEAAVAFDHAMDFREVLRCLEWMKARTGEMQVREALTPFTTWAIWRAAPAAAPMAEAEARRVLRAVADHVYCDLSVAGAAGPLAAVRAVLSDMICRMRTEAADDGVAPRHPGDCGRRDDGADHDCERSKGSNG